MCVAHPYSFQPSHIGYSYPRLHRTTACCPPNSPAEAAPAIACISWQHDDRCATHVPCQDFASSRRMKSRSASSGQRTWSKHKRHGSSTLQRTQTGGRRSASHMRLTAMHWPPGCWRCALYFHFMKCAPCVRMSATLLQAHYSSSCLCPLVWCLHNHSACAGWQACCRGC